MPQKVIDEFQIKHWVNEGIALAARTVAALERHVEQGEDLGMLPGEYVLPGDEPTAPEPSCDAPSCGCVDGMDCKANVAAEEKPDPRFYDAKGRLKKADEVDNADFVEFLRHVRDAAIARRKADPKPSPREFVVTVDGNDLHVQESGPDWRLRTAIAHRELLADTAAAIAIQAKRLDENNALLDAASALLDANNAKLEGLCKIVEDAVAERKTEKPKAVEHEYLLGSRKERVRVIPVIGSQTGRDYELWWISPETCAALKEGSLVERTDLRGQVMRVESLGSTENPEEMSIRVSSAKEA